MNMKSKCKQWITWEYYMFNLCLTSMFYVYVYIYLSIFLCVCIYVGVNPLFSLYVHACIILYKNIFEEMRKIFIMHSFWWGICNKIFLVWFVAMVDVLSGWRALMIVWLCLFVETEQLLAFWGLLWNDVFLQSF